MPWLIGFPRERVPWGPTIDPQRCTGCGVCLNCGKDVYEWGEDYPVVARPLDCVLRCSTCANLCPEGAISFPDVAELRRLYREQGIWANLIEAAKREGRMPA